ncbi:hypothetical protein Patl1_02583 [Pistacia atlantica]|uniref:Uncharacterized protein n=1 Tax=Pistacia atlantica TaxID=434234 RepID=A0ACC1C9D7_9ROSI|nr:hypothetical protein Patl1_02583 [Pistacia atlantica]
MGDSEVDVDSPVLEEEQMSSLVIHNHVDKSTFYKNVKFFPLLKYVLLLAVKLEKSVVLRAICAGFEEPTEPTVCFEWWLEHIQDPLVGVGTFTEDQKNIDFRKLDAHVHQLKGNSSIDPLSVEWAFWRELDGVKQLIKNRQLELNLENAGLMFCLELSVLPGSVKMRLLEEASQL